MDYDSPNKITDWKNEPTVAKLNTDLLEANTAQDEIKSKLTKWKLIKEGGKVDVKDPTKSKAKPLLVRKHNEDKYAILAEPFLNTEKMFDITPRTSEDVHAANQNSLVLNYQWNEDINRVKLIDDIIHTFVDEGTVIVKTGWNAEYEEEEYIDEEPVYASPEDSYIIIEKAVELGKITEEEATAMLELGEPVQIGVNKVKKTREVLVTNKPTYEVCINANVIIDPTCEGDLENANFIVHEYETSISELNKNKYIPATEDTEESGFYHNIDKINITGDTEYDEFAPYASTTFKYSDKLRKKLRAKEYWGFWDIDGTGILKPIVATWIGDVMIRMEENPFPHGKLPFSLVTYMSTSAKDIYGEPDAEILEETQNTYGSMLRAIKDITARNAAGQRFIDEQFFPTPAQKHNYERGNTVYYRSGMHPTKSMWKDSVDQIPSSAFNLIELSKNEAMELTGDNNSSKSTSSGIGKDIKPKNNDIRSKRDIHLLRKLSGILFKDMASKTIAMNQVFLDESFVVRVTDSEFVEIKRDSLKGNFDLKINISTPEKEDDKANKLIMLMQTNSASMSAELANMHYYEIAKIWGFNKLAKAIMDNKPQPNPMQDELMQLQIDNAKLENERLKKIIEESDSRILERLSRATENQHDVNLKAAKTEQVLAETRLSELKGNKLRSETDMIDKKFLDDALGLKRQQELEDEEIKMSQEALKHELANLNNKVANQINSGQQ